MTMATIRELRDWLCNSLTPTVPPMWELEYCFKPNPYEMPILFKDGVWSRISDRLLMSPMDDLQLATATQRIRVAINNI
tara:strand:- start:4 stop:240 length:237 start_codon:yes stop_codon:yes gene_type:complete